MALVLGVMAASSLRRVHQPGVRIDVHEDRGGAGEADRLGRGHEGQGDGDDFVARADAQGEQDEPECVGAVAYADGVFGTAIRGEFFLEFRDEGSAREGVGIDDLGDGREKLRPVRSMVSFEIKKRYLHFVLPVDLC